MHVPKQKKPSSQPADRCQVHDTLHASPMSQAHIGNQLKERQACFLLLPPAPVCSRPSMLRVW